MDLASTKSILASLIIGVIPVDTSTAPTLSTTKMVSGIFRYHFRMVPVATLARKHIVYGFGLHQPSNWPISASHRIDFIWKGMASGET